MRCASCKVKSICLEEGSDPVGCAEYRPAGLKRGGIQMSKAKMELLETVASTIEKLSVEIDALKAETKESENSVHVETMIVATEEIKGALAKYKPYAG